MRYRILASALLFASAGFASADYVIIVANVAPGSGTTELKTAGAGMQGGMAGMMGMRGMPGPGMMGNPGSGGFGPGGPGAGGAGMRGMPGPGMMGNPGSGGFGPGGPGAGGAGMRGGPAAPGGAGMRGGPAAPGGAGMAGAGMAGAGMRGGMAGMGGGMMMGMGGGMGGGMMGMRGGMMGGMMGGMASMMSTPDADDDPDYVIAVVEVKPLQGSLIKQLTTKGYTAVGLPSRLGKSCHLLRNPSFGEIFVISEEANKPTPTVAARFQEKFDKLLKEKPAGSEVVGFAEWTLQHGLVDKFPAVMDKAVEVDPKNPAAVAYGKIKAELDRKAGDDPSVNFWRKNLLDRYKLTETAHYLIIHNAASDTAAEIKTHSEYLENSFRGFYYWFALKGVALNVPRNRQVVVLTRTEDDFDKLKKLLTPGPVVVDGFFARRENLAVMHSQRQDDTYRALSTYWDNWKSKGFRSTDLLTGAKKLSGAPPALAAEGDKGMVLYWEAQMLALMLKALEQEAELATVSHEASRQLLFASGLLPRNVAVPEWALFGMGSFFETPLQSPWPTIGAPSPYYLPRWRELQAKGAAVGGLEKTSVDTLRKVVTDGYFRDLPADDKENQEAHLLHEHALRKARTISWSLTYFLAQQKLDGLRHYFAELSKMPRDIELDDKILFDCFARAFGCVDANNKLNESELKRLANDWYGYWQSVHFESEATMREIRKKISEKLKDTQEKAKENNGNAAPQPAQPQGQPPAPGRLPPGSNPGGRNPPAPPGRPSPPQPGGNAPPRQR